MTNKIVLTNASYDMPVDTFACDVRARIGDETFLCGTFKIFSRDGMERVELGIFQSEMSRIIDHFPVTNALMLAAVIANALEDAFTAEDEIHIDIFNREGSLTLSV